MTTTVIAKVNVEQRLVFGWASVADTADGQRIVDSQGDVIAPAELEKAAYDFVLKFREANTRHEGPTTGRLVESFVSTPDKLRAMGLPANALPLGMWVGFKVDDDPTWQAVKSGRYRAFSIEGTGKRAKL